MGVQTLFSLVFFIRKGTPHSLKVEHVKVCIFCHLLQYGHGQLTLSMSKSAQVPILTLVKSVWVGLTKLAFVLFWVIEVFYSIVGADATLSYWTLFFAASYIWTHL